MPQQYICPLTGKIFNEISIETPNRVLAALDSTVHYTAGYPGQTFQNRGKLPKTAMVVFPANRGRTAPGIFPIEISIAPWQPIRCDSHLANAAWRSRPTARSLAMELAVADSNFSARRSWSLCLQLFQLSCIWPNTSIADKDMSPRKLDCDSILSPSTAQCHEYLRPTQKASGFISGPMILSEIEVHQYYRELKKKLAPERGASHEACSPTEGKVLQKGGPGIDESGSLPG